MPTTIDPDLSIAGQLEVVQGSVADWALAAHNRDGSPAVFAVGDTLAAQLYRGQDQAALASFAASWTGGTGYLTGHLTISPTALQTAALEANGDYTLQVWWTSADLARTACILRRQVLVLPGPGIAVRTITTYCTLQDLWYAPWVKLCQGMDTDQEGFYLQRLEARRWLDWIILNNYRGGGSGQFEGHSDLAFAFAGGGRRSVGPSLSLLTWLAEDKLILRPQIVEVTAYKAISLVGLAQIGLNNQLASYGAYFRDMAERIVTSITAEIDLNGSGVASVSIPLGSTNTLFT